MKPTDIPIEALRFRAPVSLKEKATEGARRFAGIAYSGEVIRNHGFWGDIVFDLSTTKAPERLAVLRDHDPGKIVGHTETVAIGKEISVEGLFDGTDHSSEVERLSDAGFPWQMSVHIVPGEVTEIRAGAKKKVNGREVVGPCTVFSQAVIREVSFCPVGADSNTRAIALSFSPSESRLMDPSREQYDAVVAERDKFKADLESAHTRIAALEAESAARLREARMSAVKQLFAETRRQFSEEAAKPYLSMDEATFSAVAADLRASSPSLPGHLFSETVSGDAGGGAPAGESPLVASAKRRAGLK